MTIKAIGGNINSQDLNDNFSALDNEKVSKSEWFVSVKSYGAKGDGVTDDTAAIQTALDVGGCVYFPVGKYIVTDTLNINKTVLLKGVGYSILNESDNSTTIYFDNTVQNKPLFHSTVPNNRIEGIFFEGVNFGTDRRLWSKAFVMDKGSVFGDTDAIFKDCYFSRFGTCIDFEGRGLHLTSNTFEETWEPVVLKHFNNDETLNPPISDWQTNKRGFRKFHFVDNVFHACQGHAFVCESTSSNEYEQYIHQVVVTGNRLDGTGGLWKGYIGGGVVTGNTLGKSSSTVYGIEVNTFDLAGAKSVSISGNSFASELDMSSVLGKERYLGDVFYIRASGIFENLNITGNTFTGLGKRIVHTFSGVSKLNFADNIVNGVLKEKTGVSDRPFQFNELGSNIVIKNNVIIDADGVTRDYLAYFAQRGTLGCSIEGNIFENTDFSVSHNLYAYNAKDNVKMMNYTGDGASSQTLTFEQPVLFVVIAEYGTPKTIMARNGTSVSDSLIDVTDNTVIVKGSYNTSGTVYSIIAYCV